MYVGIHQSIDIFQVYIVMVIYLAHESERPADSGGHRYLPYSALPGAVVNHTITTTTKQSRKCSFYSGEEHGNDPIPNRETTDNNPNRLLVVLRVLFNKALFEPLEPWTSQTYLSTVH